jgi:hypothetical protein
VEPDDSWLKELKQYLKKCHPIDIISDIPGMWCARRERERRKEEKKRRERGEKEESGEESRREERSGKICVVGRNNI